MQRQRIKRFGVPVSKVHQRRHEVSQKGWEEIVKKPTKKVAVKVKPNPPPKPTKASKKDRPD